MAVNPKTIVEVDGKKQVYRLKDDDVELVQVKTGRTIGDNIEVNGNLKSGDKLVLSPTEKVKAGVKVVVASK